MKGLRKWFVSLLVVSLFVGGLYLEAWAQEVVQTYSTDQLNIIDVLIARPVGIIAAAGGTVIFVASLPFTLPTRSVKDSFDVFVVKPWKFSFVREFPDETPP